MFVILRNKQYSLNERSLLWYEEVRNMTARGINCATTLHCELSNCSPFPPKDADHSAILIPLLIPNEDAFSIIDSNALVSWIRLDMGYLSLLLLSLSVDKRQYKAQLKRFLFSYWREGSGQGKCGTYSSDICIKWPSSLWRPVIFLYHFSGIFP